MNLDKDTMKKIMLLIAYTILLAVLLFNFDVVLDAFGFLFGIIAPFLLGTVMAFALNLPMKFFEERLFSGKVCAKYKGAKKIARPCSLLLALISVLAVLLLVIFVVVPELGQSIVSLGNTIQSVIPLAEAWIIEQFPDNQTISQWVNSLDFNWNQIIGNLINFLKNGAGDMLSGTFSIAVSIINTLANVAIGFVFAIYILLQKEKLRAQVEKVMQAFLPEKQRNIIEKVCSLTYRTFANFLTGQCLEAVILGTMFFITLTVLRYPYALLIGVLIAFTALIPIFGAFIGCVIGAFLILMISPVKALIFIGVFLVLQQIEGNLIYPHVVGGSVGLPSIWVLAAVSIGASLMGVVGMIIFIPLTSILYSLFREAVNAELKKQKQAP